MGIELQLLNNHVIMFNVLYKLKKEIIFLQIEIIFLQIINYMLNEFFVDPCFFINII